MTTLQLTIIGTARTLPDQLKALRCRYCNGTGEEEHFKEIGGKEVCRVSKCSACKGTGVEV